MGTVTSVLGLWQMFFSEAAEDTQLCMQELEFISDTGPVAALPTEVVYKTHSWFVSSLMQTGKKLLPALLVDFLAILSFRVI